MTQVDHMMGHKHVAVEGMEGGGQNFAFWLEKESVSWMKELEDKFNREGNWWWSGIQGCSWWRKCAYYFQSTDGSFGARWMQCS